MLLYTIKGCNKMKIHGSLRPLITARIYISLISNSSINVNEKRNRARSFHEVAAKLNIVLIKRAAAVLKCSINENSFPLTFTLSLLIAAALEYQINF